MEGFKVREEDNMSKPRGKYELEKGLKFIEEIEKSLKDAKTYLIDPEYPNCETLGSYILEKDIPDLLTDALRYIGHSDTYKRDHNIGEFDKNRIKKRTIYKNINNSKESSTNRFMDENLKIDVPTLILNYLDHDDKESLNILKEYCKTDFLTGMSPECECFWYVKHHISNTLSDLNDIITDAERYKIGMDKLKKQFDEDTLWWFEEIARTGRLYSTDTFDYEKSRAIKAYNYYSTHPEIGKIFLSRDAVLKFKREISENRGCFSKFSDLNLYKYRNKLINEFEELEKDKERDARREQEFLKNYGKH